MLHFLEQFVDNDEDMEFMPLVSIDDEDANPDNEQPEYNEEIPSRSSDTYYRRS